MAGDAFQDRYGDLTSHCYGCGRQNDKSLQIKGRKVVVTSKLLAKGEVCAEGKVVAVQVPEGLMKQVAESAES